MTSDLQNARVSGVEMVVGVIGAGTMGVGIAQVAAQAGHHVLLYDNRPGAAMAAVGDIAAALHKQAARGRVTRSQAEAASAAINAVEHLELLKPCSLIVEAVVEDLWVKKSLFQSLEDLLSSQALFATNTSSLSVTAIGSCLRRPERLAGMHFFNPAPVMPLVEVIAGVLTAEETLVTLEAIARSWGKETVRARSSPGFIVNRVARPFYGEALRLLQEQVSDPATLDGLFRDAGNFRMGPCELMDLIGHDINFTVTQSVFEAMFYDSRFSPSTLQRELVASGRLGRKSGQGFYAYGSSESRPEPCSLPVKPIPAQVRLFGDDPLTVALHKRLHAAKFETDLLPAHIDQRLAETASAVLYRTDGRSATQRARECDRPNLVLIDLALDYNVASRVAISAAAQARPDALEEIAGLLQTGKFAVSVLDDAPGMALMRTVAMLANEAADAVQQNVCSAADCDKAMRLGTNYPLGPLAWADALGAATLVTVLDNLHAAYGDTRYRVSPLLRKKALTGSSFRINQDQVRE